jgi:DNA-binding beta-propeller fold protein YncE
MATTLPLKIVTRAGVTPAQIGAITVPAGTELELLDNDGNIIVFIGNTGAATWVDVIPTAMTGGFSLANLRVTVPNGGVWFGPLPPAVFNGANDSVFLRVDPAAAGVLTAHALGI